MENTGSPKTSADAIVVGAGLAGLSAAALIAQAGRSVIVLEQGSQIGGRARTHVRQGIHWNMGPHALYCSGHAFRLFTALGIPFRGRFPNPGRGLLVRGGVSWPLPTGLGSVLTTRLFTMHEKWRLARFMTALPKLETGPFVSITLREWLDKTIGPGNLALFLAALFRLSTYSNDPERMSAGVALEQLKLALAGNVWYLDGGWQTLVDGLRDHATASGADVRTHARVVNVKSDPGGVTVRLAGNDELFAGAVVLAVEPEKVREMLQLSDSSPLAQWIARRQPIQAACLDLALSRLPRPNGRFALGLDRPLYYSVHSAAAHLAPRGVVVVHVAKYLGAEPNDLSQGAQDELENFLDVLQPGWREHVLARRFLPNMTVTHHLPTAGNDGLVDRPDTVLTDHQRVYLAGDWVGPEGMLADASAASAASAARCVLTAREVTVRGHSHVDRHT